MIEADYEAFGNEFRRLSSALDRFPPRGDELATKVDAYFHALKKYPLSEVVLKADKWLETEKKFPAPAEWAGVIVRRSVPLPTLTDAESREYRDAEKRRWEGEPCNCASCFQAGVNEKPIRFVPDLTRDERDDAALDPVTNRLVCRGHWAHGWELARWYEAKANFYNRCLELGWRRDVLMPGAGKGRGKQDELEPVTP